jgi:hypothetical protein
MVKFPFYFEMQVDTQQKGKIMQHLVEGSKATCEIMTI